MLCEVSVLFVWQLRGDEATQLSSVVHALYGVRVGVFCARVVWGQGVCACVVHAFCGISVCVAVKLFSFCNVLHLFV